MKKLLLFALFASGCCGTAATRPLFDGKTLDNWKPTEFGGEGKVHVEDGTLILDMGMTLTGVTWAGGELPRTNYEIRLEAARIRGGDFFCGLTFPVGDDPCSLIVGGWGGGVVGLSSLDGLDASENSTSSYREFEQGRWYRIRLRVRPDRITAWIDDEKVIDVDLKGRTIGIRPEVDASRPLGIASWMTTAGLRNIELRRMK